MSLFNYSAMEDAVIGKIEALLGDSKDLPIFYPNAEEVASDNPETRPGAYVEVHILHATPRQADTGTSNTRTRRPGIIQVGVFTRLGKGTKRSTEIVDILVAGLRRVTITGSGGTVKCENSGPLPGTREGGYWRVDVDTRFNSDDFDS